MPLDAAELTEIETMLSETIDPVQVVGGLRQRFPELTVTRCDASDVDAETPFRTLVHVLLYLVDGSDHCWRLTTDATRATGLVVVAT